MTLPPEPSSVRIARRHVGQRVSELGFEDVAEVAELLVSELVTNAVLHARTPITLAVDTYDDVVRVAVEDESPEVPRPRRHSVDAGTGRGLVLVERMAAKWGVERTADGKSVWIELGREPVSDEELWDTWEA